MQALPHVAASGLTAPLCSTQSPKCLHGDLHGSPSARQLSHPRFQNSNSSIHSWQGRAVGQFRAGRIGGGVHAASSMAEVQKWHLAIPMAGWFPQRPIRPQKCSPPPFTRPLLTKRPGLADLHRPPANPMRQRPPARRLHWWSRSSYWASCANPTRHLRFLALGHTSQLQVRRSPRRHWLADQVGEKSSASVMACRSIASRKG